MIHRITNTDVSESSKWNKLQSNTLYSWNCCIVYILNHWSFLCNWLLYPSWNLKLNVSVFLNLRPYLSPIQTA